jgi:putative transposase
VIRRTFKYRLYPTKRQVEMLVRSLDLCAELYNAALQERRDAWRLNRVTINFFGQCKQLSEIRRERPEFAEMSFDVAADALKRVDRAFTAFFLRVRRGGTPGYPRFKPARRYDSITFRKVGHALEGGRLRLPKVGRVKINLHRPLEGVVKEIHVKRSCGKWYAAFSVICEPKPLPACDARVGIDVGLSSFATLDDGREFANPRWYSKAQAKLRRAQRRVARRRTDSSRRAKVVALLAKIHARVRDQRADFHHKLSTATASSLSRI